MHPLFIYGAQGYTGSLVHAAARQQLEVVAASRSPVADGVSLDLGDRQAVRRAVSGCGAVLNCAGPFASTWRPLVEACLESGTHYLDLCAEWAVFEDLAALSDVARERGVMLLPGVGFDVVASDGLAVHVSERLPGATSLEIGISGLELASRGSLRTILDLVGEPVRVRRGGRIVPEPRLLESSFDFGTGSRPALAVSWGDVSTAFHSTGIPDVTVYFEATPLTMSLTLGNRAFGWMMKNPLWQRLARAQVELLPPGPRPHERVGRRAVIVARAEDGDGGQAEARLVTPEAYTFTVACSVAIARRVLDGAVRPGFQTPATLLGPDLAMELDGVTREDLV